MKNKLLLIPIFLLFLSSCIERSVIPSPDQSGYPLLFLPKTSGDLKSLLLNNLENSGHNFPEIISESVPYELKIELEPVDINNDTFIDIILIYSLFNFNEPGSYNDETGLTVFINDSDTYTIGYEDNSDLWESEYNLTFVEDFIHNESHEIIASHTINEGSCEKRFMVITFIEDNLVDIIPPYPVWECDSEIFPSMNNDGTWSFMVIGKPIIDSGLNDPNGGIYSFIEGEHYLILDFVYDNE